jgi:phospholipid/cholesterol/gamma-HCH transport system substrate-binding protein
MADITIRIPEKVIRIAVTVAAAIVLLLFAGQLWSSGAFRPHYQLQIFVPKADGLRAGNEVWLSGMRVGSVSKVEFEERPSDPDRSIRVTLRIEQRYQSRIRSDATASLLRIGFRPDRYVDIHASRTGEPIAAGGEIRVRPTYEPTAMEFIDALKRFNCKGDAKTPEDNQAQTTK